MILCVSLYGQLTAVKKGIEGPMLPDCIAGSSVQLIEVTRFLLSHPLTSCWFIDHMLRSIMKRPYNK